MNKKKKKVYYVALRKSDNILIIRVTKREIADFLNISIDTVNRRLNHENMFSCDEYSIWCNIHIPVLKRGFYLKPKYNSLYH